MWQPHNKGGWGADGNMAISNKEWCGQKRGRWYCSLPFGVVALKAPCSQATYEGNLYLAGGYSHNLVLDTHHRLWKQGIRAPGEVPEFTSGGGSGTLTAYFSWYDEFTGERSPLSLGTAVDIPLGSSRQWINLPERPPDDYYANDDIVDLDGTGGDFDQGIWWIDDTETPGGRISLMRPGDEIDLLDATNRRFSMAFWMKPLCFDRFNDWSTMIPTDSPVDIVPVTRATHLELWLQPAADFPRLALRVARGTQTVTEATALGDLGEAFISSFQRLPRGTVNAIYHDRQILAGDPANPDTVYLSQLFYPERWDGLAYRTKSGEPVTGILSTRDYCLVFTRNSTYMLQGYTDTDYTFQLIDQSLGAVGHNCNVVIHGNPYVWTEKGPYMYNGAFHPLSPENRWLPVSDFVEGTLFTPQDPLKSAGPNMVATDDPYFNTYIVSEAHVAARNFDRPYMEPHEDILGPTVTSDDHYFAVLDYTVVAPETGGALRPARLSFDRKLSEGNSDVEFIKYLRAPWGAGALYHVGAGPIISGYTDPYSESIGPSTYGCSFVITAMMNYNVASSFALPTSFWRRVQPRLILPYYYFNEFGGFPFEAKKFTRLWFHFSGLDDSGWTIAVYSGPDSSFWNDNWVGHSRELWGTTRQYQNSGLILDARNLGIDLSTAEADRDRITEGILYASPLDFQGRGLWLDIRWNRNPSSELYPAYEGYFLGFGGEFVPGVTNQVFIEGGEP